MARYQEPVDGRIPLRGINACAMLDEGQFDRDSAAGTLEEVGVGSDVALECWGCG